MFTFLLILEVVLGLLLIGAILLQRSKEQGLGLAFGQGLGESLFGAQTVTVLVKATIVLAVLFFLNTIILARKVSPSHVIMAPPPPVEQPSGNMPAPMRPADSGTPMQGGAGYPVAPVSGSATEMPADGGAAGSVPAAVPAVQ